MPASLSGLGRRVTRIALVHIGQRHALLGGLLHLSRQFRHLRPLLLVCGRDMNRQQMTERVYSDVDLAAVLPLVAPS